MNNMNAESEVKLPDFITEYNKTHERPNLLQKKKSPNSFECVRKTTKQLKTADLKVYNEPINSQNYLTHFYVTNETARVSQASN